MKRVVHCKRDAHDVYIGRPSVWGNPFMIGRDGNRSMVIAKYRTWLLGQPELLARCRTELRGKVLGCWCAPEPCHGDVLAEIANEPQCEQTEFAQLLGDDELRDSVAREQERLRTACLVDENMPAMLRKQAW